MKRFIDKCTGKLINIAINMRMYEQSVQHRYRYETYEKFCKRKTELYECKFYTNMTQIKC